MVHNRREAKKMKELKARNTCHLIRNLIQEWRSSRLRTMSQWNHIRKHRCHLRHQQFSLFTAKYYGRLAILTCQRAMLVPHVVGKTHIS
ncbi:hypothetical protein LINGRAHAP2_LOCUS31358 [Linum grandiflorum]